MATRKAGHRAPLIAHRFRLTAYSWGSP